jgi:hypothetical protein
MGIRCSIFGCEYEDTTIERDEKRHGDEVILTVREYRQCTRCENTELISENTGITTLADEEREVGEAEPEPTDPSASDPESTERPEVTADSGAEYRHRYGGTDRERGTERVGRTTRNDRHRGQAPRRPRRDSDGRGRIVDHRRDR